MGTRRIRFALFGSLLLLAALVVPLAALPTHAAATFANPVFERQWQADDGKATNVWGPLANARDGQQEPYGGAMRLVQYFDKGRMELGRDGAVTNGLLATEMVRGQVQTDDAAFQARPAPAIPLAGDADNPGPTYAQLSTRAAALLAATPNQTVPRSSQAVGDLAMGPRISRVVTANGDLTTGNPPSNEGTTISDYDEATKHNVAFAFTFYRSRVGLETIGYAISEPFFATVKVGGRMTDVVIQVFERRVLTYTASNPEVFRVEMGNIGQHYYRWRYETPLPTPAPPPTATAPPVVAPATATPLPTVVAPSVVATTDPRRAPTANVATITAQAAPGGPIRTGFVDRGAGAAAGGAASISYQAQPNTACSISYKAPPNTSAPPPSLVSQMAGESGYVRWSIAIPKATTPGVASVTVTCGGKSDTVSFPVAAAR